MNRLAMLFLVLVGMPAFAASEHTIHSRILDQDRGITVSLPESYFQQDTRSYPVLYLLDGENNLDFTSATSRYLADNGITPELIVVGIHAGATRSIDFLPASDDGQSGRRAGLFLEHLETELIPFVEKAYRAAPVRILSGHSLGGLFTLYAQTRKPTLFHGYIAQSPYLVPGIGEPLVDAYIGFLETSGIGEARVHVSLGKEPGIEPEFDRLVAAAEAKINDPNRWAFSKYENKTHMTTRLIGSHDAQEFFFANWKIPQKKLLGERAGAVTQHIEELSKKHGYAVLPGKSQFATWVQLMLAAKDTGSALSVAELFVDYYPGSPTAHFLLANAAATSGKIAVAKTAINTVIELYEENPDPALEAIYSGAQQLRTQLGG